MDGNVTLNEPQQYSYGLTIYVGGPIERSWCPFMRYSPVESVFEEETVRASASKELPPSYYYDDGRLSSTP